MKTNTYANICAKKHYLQPQNRSKLYLNNIKISLFCITSKIIILTIKKFLKDSNSKHLTQTKTKNLIQIV